MKCSVLALCIVFCIIENAPAQTKQIKRSLAADTTAAKKSYTIKKAIRGLPALCIYRTWRIDVVKCLEK